MIESLEKRGKLKKPEGEWSEDDGANLLGVLSSVVGAGAKKKGDQASSSVITKCGATPLWIAACNGHGKMVSLLVQRGARTETMCDSTSPLWIAAANGNFEAIQALCYHADKESRAIDGATPLWVACENGHRECVRHLLDAGSKIDARTIDQRTPLHIASVGFSFFVLAM